MFRRNSKWRAGGSVIGVLAMTATIGVGVIGLSSSVAGAKQTGVELAEQADW